MVRSAVSKVMWLGRVTVFVVGLAVVLALVFRFATTALGATGDAFELGRKNVANQATRLFASSPGAALFVSNTGEAPALNLQVKDGQAPVKTNSETKVNNLNADMVDGLTAEELRGQKGDKGDQGKPGLDGEDGASVENVQLNPGDNNCTVTGGSQFTVRGSDATTTTFACNGGIARPGG